MVHKHDSIAKNDQDNLNSSSNVPDFNVNPLNVPNVFENESENSKELNNSKNSNGDLSATITSSGLQWDSLDINSKEPDETDDNVRNDCGTNNESQIDSLTSESQYQDSVIDLTGPVNVKAEQWGDIMTETDELNKENEQPTTNDNNINSTIENNIPYAVGLLPLKQVQPADGSLLKRKNSIDVDLLDNVDAKCLKRKVKYKKL